LTYERVKEIPELERRRRYANGTNTGHYFYRWVNAPNEEYKSQAEAVEHKPHMECKMCRQPKSKTRHTCGRERQQKRGRGGAAAAVPERRRSRSPIPVESRAYGKKEDWARYPSQSRAALELNVNIDSIQRCIAGSQQHAGGNEFRKAKKRRAVAVGGKKKPSRCGRIEGRLAGSSLWIVYESQSDASRQLRVPRPDISRCMTGKIADVGGFEFRWATGESEAEGDEDSDEDGDVDSDEDEEEGSEAEEGGRARKRSTKGKVLPTRGVSDRVRIVDGDVEEVFVVRLDDDNVYRGEWIRSLSFENDRRTGSAWPRRIQ